MASFTPPTYNQPVGDRSREWDGMTRLGSHGVSFPVGKIVYIDTGDNVHETTSIMGKFSEHVSPDELGIASGSGDGGYAIFRRGKTYTITAGEDTLLTAAGYTTS